MLDIDFHYGGKFINIPIPYTTEALWWEKIKRIKNYGSTNITNFLFKGAFIILH